MTLYSEQEIVKGFKLMTYSRFYSECQSAFTAIESFVGIEKFGLILGACFFYPYPSSFLSRKEISFKQHWIDIYGNSLYFKDDYENNMKFIESDFQIEKKYIFNVDPYTGWSIKDHIKLGKNFYISIGKDNDTLEPVASLIIRGKDNHLRGFIYTDRWRKISPLYLNPRFVKSIYFLDVDISSIPATSFYNCVDISHYIGYNSKSAMSFLNDFF
jgi:hypothetical protein